MLERSIRPPMTAIRFWTLTEEHARRTGISDEAAFGSLVRGLSDDDLDRLTSEFEQIAFGDDTAARDEAKRKTLAEAGFVHARQIDRRAR